jgi:hypothetical protein
MYTRAVLNGRKEGSISVMPLVNIKCPAAVRNNIRHMARLPLNNSCQLPVVKRAINNAMINAPSNTIKGFKVVCF